MTGMNAVGYYGISVRLMKTFNVPFNSLSMALLPRISAQFKRKNLKGKFSKTKQ